jgi:uncharacterized protein (DUF1697 family)
MKSYAVLIRGINVGGKNKVSMSSLRTCLEELGFMGVLTYIASGNVILKSDKPVDEIKVVIEKTLPIVFQLDSQLIKVLVLSHAQLEAVIEDKPMGFGDEPDKYYCDTIFLIDIDVSEAMSVFKPRVGVDRVWPGNGVIYFERLSELRTKSRLNSIIGTQPYKSMTIRNWNTTNKLLSFLDASESE